QSCRAAGGAAHALSSHHQSHNRQGPRSHHPGNAVGHCQRGHSMIRRKFIVGLGSAAAWPMVARAQRLDVPVIGFLSPGGNPPPANLVAAFRQGLLETGYVEGRNVEIEYRSAEGHYDRLPALAAELVKRRVAVLFAGGAPTAPAAKAAT